MSVTIRHALPKENSQVLALFSAHAESLGIDLTFQNFHDELASFPGNYFSAEGGALLVAELPATTETANSTENGRVIGCVALRRNTSTWCKMKRLYVTPQARRTGAGEKLVEAIIQHAKELGYGGMRLDTLPEMVAAQKLYRRFGFERIEKYYETPLEETVFMGVGCGGSEVSVLGNSEAIQVKP